MRRTAPTTTNEHQSMKKSVSERLREDFLEFFKGLNHEIVPSSPVVPEGDPTLLFTNAGMNQFKDVLLGLEKRPYTRAASVQKCIRAGGKHNDLDEVGKDGRHLTFFEMLGNWSFGDYGKEEAILWAWQFVTGPLGLNPERLYVSVYRDDDESFAIWQNIVGLDSARIVRLGNVEEGDEENFWSMGPTGPCGRCTEIYYDHHPEAGPVAWEPGFDEERFVEIWNLVFMESDRAEDGSVKPLPMLSVDTGMGLDRVAAILEEVDNVFQTSIFASVIEKTHQLLTGNKLSSQEIDKLDTFVEYCVIADHVRSVTFSVCDGATFSNEGRGYVLRRILRRAVRHGRNLGFDQPFLHRVMDAVVETFGPVYPELRLKHHEAATIIRAEEERFFSTLDRGLALFDEVANKTIASKVRQIDGSAVFKLYDTFGFPPDLTEILAQERGLTIDHEGYDAAMVRQRERSRAADARHTATEEWTIINDGAADSFIGYNELHARTQVLRFRTDPATERIEVCLRDTPFYAESGGQVGDCGQIETEDGSIRLTVESTVKTTAGLTHICRLLEGDVSANNFRKDVIATVDAVARAKTAANHTATHLLHAALHTHVSSNAFQAGSLVAVDRLRFDFSHDGPVSPEQLRAIERTVNGEISANHAVVVREDVPLSEAEKLGAMMMFGEKYGAYVRVVDIDGRSLELCGGTHVPTTGAIAYFRIVQESGVAAGVRRIEAVTGDVAFAQADNDRQLVERLARTLKTTPHEVEASVSRLLVELKDQERKLNQLAQLRARLVANDLADAHLLVGDVRTVSARVTIDQRDDLLRVADALRDRFDNRAFVALLAAELDGSAALVVVCSDDLTKDRRVKAGALIQQIAPIVGGRGGGRPNLAQAGGPDIAKIDAAIAQFHAVAEAALTTTD